MPGEQAPREHAVVTGGSSGIGLAVVRRLMKRGLAVTVLDMQEPPDDVPRAFRVDVTDEAKVRDALDASAREAGTPTRLVTCHGIRGEFKPALELDLDAYRRVLDVHLVGTLVTARSLVAGMLEAGLRGGSVVTISSTTAYGGWRDQADYGVAKAAIEQLTQNLAIEWAPHGIRVNAVAPGHTLTPMVQEMVDQGYDLSATEARMPLGRLCSPDEMAAAIEFMLLDATFSTGVRMPVDGGWTVVGK
ncbi:SDR family NAD(P)-dependent oxidoreductase [Actinomadura sp. WAC 06369]|uniref:SDR family NAD(P)-dependent oxidoreductase n=1 Tax=Actinomadura sp. WAC 06369 TaxID=2203193 RepID=UPI000F782A98|nr:SDR family oxidoreductase [Actinomadura sp. WAC 06369]RSN72115.1 NAD(P)-dependent oxidoreductase [Actinomadura sp. WAC 06369]